MPGLKRLKIDNGEIYTDCSPQHGPHGFHVLPCGPTRVDDTAEQNDEHTDPDGPCQDIARPGEQLPCGPRRDHLLRRYLQLLRPFQYVLESPFSLLHVRHSHRPSYSYCGYQPSPRFSSASPECFAGARPRALG